MSTDVDLDWKRISILNTAASDAQRGMCTIGDCLAPLAPEGRSQ